MQKIKLEIKGITLKINVVGMFLAILIIGCLGAYIIKNRECVKNSDEISYAIDNASMTKQDENIEILWEFNTAHRSMSCVYFGLDNAMEYAGEKLIIKVETNKGFRQTQEYVVQGETTTENCGMGLLEAIGRGKKCRLSVTGETEVISNIIYGTVCYEYYNIYVLIPLFWCCMLIFFNFSIRIESEKKWCKIIRRGYKIVSLMSIPILLVYIMEYMSGSLSALKPHILITNIVICACLYLVVFVITNRLRFSALFTSCIVYALATAEYFVLLFRGSPLIPYDIMSFRTALSVVGQYEVEINDKIVFSVLIFIAVISAASRMSFKIQGYKKRIGFAAIGTGITAGMLMLFYGFLYEAWGLTYSTWAPIDTYMNDGYFMSTMVFAKYATVHKPEGYSAKKAEEILESFEYGTESEETQKPVNLIVVMNESWSDFTYIDEVETNIPYNTFYQDLSENTIKGNLYVSIC